jgi:hypothetical protein
MDEFLAIARRAYRDFGNREMRPDRWDKADTAMHGPALALKRKLESRFRELLGMVSEKQTDAPGDSTDVVGDE